jgi:MazG family protein
LGRPPIAPAQYSFDDLIAIMARLRAPDGCPWDREQTLQSLRPYLIEEAYELLEAMEGGDPDRHCEELGDLLLQIVFQSQLAAERGDFDARAVVAGLCRKLVRRHPHVFGDESAASADEVVVHWERIKRQEKQRRDGAAPAGALGGVPASLPGLLAAQKLGQRAARVGFDWDGPQAVRAKLHEELGELEQALDAAPGAEQRAASAWELGDLLFAATNLARHLDIDAEDALRRANQRFRSRFALVERLAAERGIDLRQADMTALEALWQEAKDRLDPAAKQP